MGKIPEDILKSATDTLLSITAREGGCPSINWYLLRNRVASAILAERQANQTECSRYAYERDIARRERDETATHLIAAAPELYEALKHVVSIFEHHASTPEEINAIGLSLNVLGTAEGDEGGAA